MGSEVTTEELLNAFGTGYANWSQSGRRVELTADFGAPGGDAEKQHIEAVTVHEFNTAKLKMLFADLEGRGLSEVALAKAATVSPLELRRVADQLR